MSLLKIPVPPNVTLPREAYKFWPDSHYIYHGQGKKLIRHIFEFQQLTEFENEKLSRLEEEIKSSKLDDLQVPSAWTRNHLLRFCYGTGWKTRNAVKALVSHLKWLDRQNSQSPESIYPRVLPLLQSGAFYIFGRDSMYRPLIVMNFSKIDLKKVKNSIEDYIEMLCFLLDYIVAHMLLPGQVENWVVLIDLGKKSLGNLSVSSLKQVLSILQANYRCRMGMTYIVNPPKSIWMLWSCIKPFLDETTVEKIKISNSSQSIEMNAVFNPYQIEEKYGGRASNALNYWPPYISESGFDIPGSKIPISIKDSYEHFFPQAKEILQNSPSVFSLSKSKINSLDASLEHSEISIEDLDKNDFCFSDREDKEVLHDLEQGSPFRKTGERSPQKIMSGVKGEMVESVKKSSKKKEIDENEVPEGNDYSKTPKKNGPRAIGIIIERDNRWNNCGRLACCENIDTQCLIY